MHISKHFQKCFIILKFRKITIWLLSDAPSWRSVCNYLHHSRQRSLRSGHIWWVNILGSVTIAQLCSLSIHCLPLQVLKRDHSLVLQNSQAPSKRETFAIVQMVFGLWPPPTRWLFHFVVVMVFSWSNIALLYKSTTFFAWLPPFVLVMVNLACMWSAWWVWVCLSHRRSHFHAHLVVIIVLQKQQRKIKNRGALNSQIYEFQVFKFIKTINTCIVKSCEKNKKKSVE